MTKRQLRHLASGLLVAWLVLLPIKAEAQSVPQGPPPEITPPDGNLGDTGGKGSAAPKPVGTGDRPGSSAGLPVTGGDVAELTIIGLALVAGGTIIRRTARR
jgi:hypothetical protein